MLVVWMCSLIRQTIKIKQKRKQNKKVLVKKIISSLISFVYEDKGTKDVKQNIGKVTNKTKNKKNLIEKSTTFIVNENILSEIRV